MRVDRVLPGYEGGRQWYEYQRSGWFTQTRDQIKERYPVGWESTLFKYDPPPAFGRSVEGDEQGMDVGC